MSFRLTCDIAASWFPFIGFASASASLFPFAPTSSSIPCTIFDPTVNIFLISFLSVLVTF